MNLLQAMDDENLFARHGFAAPSWAPWKAFVSALFGLPVPPDQRELARECTGYDQAPSSPVREAWVVAGRRAGKSRIFALIAVYLATFKDWSSCLAPGERGYVAGFCRILRAYGLHSVQADRHGRGPFAEAFLRHGIGYDASAPSKTNLYADLIASISSGSIDLLDLPRLREQILGLELQATAGGERIAMPRASAGRALHDDIVNAAAGALARAGARRRMTVLEGLAVEEEGISPAQLAHDRGLVNHMLSLRRQGLL